MASRSSTRNKIQALLSSFLHEKEEGLKEGKTQDISESPGILSTLCQPRNRESFYERVETFSSFTWFMKPLYLSPQHCALYGWENTDVDLLTCVSCKATLDGTVGTDWDSAMYNTICLKLKSNIINGHSKFCPWKDSPCPESFLSLPAKSPLEWEQRFQSACRNLLVFQDDLPVLKRESFQEMELTEDILSILSHDITGCDESYHQDIVDTISVMALCGWNTSAKERSGILYCSACHREAGLWNFCSLKSLSQIKSGAKEIAEYEEETAVREVEQTLPFERWTNDRMQEFEGEMEQDVSCEGEINEGTEGAQRERSGDDVEMIHEVGIMGDTGDTQKEEPEIDKQVKCGDEAMGTEEDMACEDGITENEDGEKVGVDEKRLEDEYGDTQTPALQTGAEEEKLQDGTGGDQQVLKPETEEKLQEAGTSEDNEGTCKFEKESEEPCVDPATSATLGNDIAVGTERQSDSNISSKENTIIESSLREADDQSSEETSRREELCLEQTPEERKNWSSDQTVPTEPFFSADIEEEPVSSEYGLEIQTTTIVELFPSDSSPLTEQEMRSGDNNTATEPRPDQDPPVQKSTQYQEPDEKQFHEEHTSDVKKEPTSEEPFHSLGNEREMTVKDAASENETSNNISNESLQQTDAISVEHSEEENKTFEPSEACMVDTPEPSFDEVRCSHNLENIVPHEARESSAGIEPSKLFSAAVFSPVHSRQDSLIVEVGEDSLSERLQSIQSELEGNGTSARMESSRSLSELSDSEAEGPNTKRLKTEDVEKTEFDVLAEHRNWCPWVTAVPSLNPNNTSGVVQKYPGWKILLGILIESLSPDKPGTVHQTPPSQVWKSVRRLFHDCHATILRGTGTKSHSLERKVSALNSCQ